MSHVFATYLDSMENEDHRQQLQVVLDWVLDEFPMLDPQIKWNVPMFLHEGTFIVSIDSAKKHFTVAPERKGMVTFEEELKKRGISYSKMLFRFPYDKPVDYDMIHKVISFNLEDKQGYDKFWR